MSMNEHRPVPTRRKGEIAGFCSSSSVGYLQLDEQYGSLCICWRSLSTILHRWYFPGRRWSFRRAPGLGISLRAKQHFGVWSPENNSHWNYPRESPDQDSVRVSDQSNGYRWNQHLDNRTNFIRWHASHIETRTASDEIDMCWMHSL